MRRPNTRHQPERRGAAVGLQRARGADGDKAPEGRGGFSCSGPPFAFASAVGGGAIGRLFGGAIGCPRSGPVVAAPAIFCRSPGVNADGGFASMTMASCDFPMLPTFLWTGLLATGGYIY